MAAAVTSMAAMTSCCCSSRQFLNNNKKQARRAAFISASAKTDPYQTLSVHRGASESDVKKAFRRLALQYHPDVCREDNCTVKFLQINQAYDMLISNLREESTEVAEKETYNDPDEQFRGMEDSEWDMWEEWMGWEGAGIRDYSSHINPYI